MTEPERDRYDVVPYPSYAYPYTHPDRLHVLARLFGLDPAPIRRARVLELGCSSAGNLLPIAELLPDAEIVGIDRSSVQIEQGRERIAKLGLTNIRLEVVDLLELDPAELGRFDYVICHGVFSWVPPAVQDRILQLFRQLLREQGVAFVSFNVYPGWHLREVVRRMMAFHVRQFDDPRKQIEQARALVEFLAPSVTDRNGPFALLLERERQFIQAMPDSYLFHEHLEQENRPMYFHEFIDRLQGTGLQYLCDSDLHFMVARDLPDDVRETLHRITVDQVAFEQYLDFLRNRQFRTTLLCSADLPLRREIGPLRMLGLRFGFQGEVLGESVDLSPGVAQTFRTTEGIAIDTHSPITKAALLELLARWPATLEIEPLLEAAEARLAAAGIERSTAAFPERRNALATDLIECLLRKTLVVRGWEPPLPDAPLAQLERPRVSALNRLLAREDGDIVSLHHRRHPLDGTLRELVPLLDGEHDRAALAEALLQAVADKRLQLSEHGEPVTDLEHQRRLMPTIVESGLEAIEKLPALVRDP